MPATDRRNTVCNKINEEVESLLQSDSFLDWLESSSLKSGDLAVFNNSFLFREGFSGTTKNAKYLCVQMDHAGNQASPIQVIQPSSINLRFKRIPARQATGIEVESLEESVSQELMHLGVMVRALVGRIGEDESASVTIDKVPNWHTLSYQPKQSDVVQIYNGTLSINRVDDLDAAWSAISSGLTAGNFDDVDRLSEAFEAKFTELREKAYRPVNVDDISPNSPSILSEIIERIESQIDGYSHSLQAHLADADDTESSNDLLRIAYNFADGTQELMKLVIGVSDLKAVVFWLTISAQSNLADHFGDLPFGIIGKEKPSLNRYRAIIAGARNRAFHDIFAVGRPFRARLTGDAFKTPELRLFRQYASKTPALDYEDRKLVELLEGFTRSTERPVPLGFWETNLSVMNAVAEVARALRDGLLMAVSS